MDGTSGIGVAHRSDTATDLKLRANPTRSHSSRPPPRRPRLPSAAAAAAAGTSRHRLTASVRAAFESLYTMS